MRPPPGRLGRKVARLLLGARRVERLEQVAAEARKAGAAEAHVHELDVSKTPSVEAFVTWAGKRSASRNPPPSIWTC